jgi:flavin reductase (DIM6/NTAB) family NADH-FMN oxidoreductase RutF
MPIDRNELRRVMGHFATGVAVITTRSASGEFYGLTVNALSSLSLTPPLLLICIDKKSESYPCFDESKVFNVNILNTDQEDISRRFASNSISGPKKFEGTSYRIGANGVPILTGALAYLECRVTAAFDGGDHTIYVGEIEQADAVEGEPLLFFRGGYRAIGS